jgi:hypothetical protein
LDRDCNEVGTKLPDLLCVPTVKHRVAFDSWSTTAMSWTRKRTKLPDLLCVPTIKRVTLDSWIATTIPLPTSDNWWSSTPAWVHRSLVDRKARKSAALNWAPPTLSVFTGQLVFRFCLKLIKYGNWSIPETT